MSLDKLQAVGEFLFVLRDEPESEVGGLIIPDLSKEKTNTGLILTVGINVNDTNVKKGMKAVFNKAAGSTM